jgi:hypothetical protein
MNENQPNPDLRDAVKKLILKFEAETPSKPKTPDSAPPTPTETPTK